jgi:WXG100 family type VII secretion target
MQGVSGKLVSDYESLQAAISTLQGKADVHSATWDGAAKAAWNTAMENVNAAWNKLNVVLDDIAHNVNTSGANYGTTDADNASNLGKVPTGDITAALNR